MPYLCGFEAFYGKKIMRITGLEKASVIRIFTAFLEPSALSGGRQGAKSKQNYVSQRVSVLLFQVLCDMNIYLSGYL